MEDVAEFAAQRTLMALNVTSELPEKFQYRG